MFNLTFLINATNNVGPAKLFLHVDVKTFTLNERILSKGSVNVTSDPITVTTGTNGNLFVFTAKNTGNVTIVDLNFHILTADVFYVDVPSSNPLGSLTANNITFA